MLKVPKRLILKYVWHYRVKKLENICNAILRFYIYFSLFEAIHAEMSELNFHKMDSGIKQ